MIKYLTPEMEIVLVDTEDIILASTEQTTPSKPNDELPDEEW